MYTLKVKLKQHTPLIHFQWDQKGATLRASEVKPKLDRFILTRLGREKDSANYEKAEKSYDDTKKISGAFEKLEDHERGYWIAKSLGWLVGAGEKPALDYRMRIVAGGEPRESLITAGIVGDVGNKPADVDIYSNTSFFAQEKINSGRESVLRREEGLPRTSYNFHPQSWNEIGKKGVCWEDITLTVSSYCMDLKKQVEQELELFFICTNFGTRADKGFGSFTVIPIPGENRDYGQFLAGYYTFVYKKVVENTKVLKNGKVETLSKVQMTESIFQIIKKDYQLLKSGFNRIDYRKSLLFCYAVEKMKGNPRWEKRKMKQIIRDNIQSPYSLLTTSRNPEPIYGICAGDQSWNDPKEGFNYTFLRAVLGLAEQYEFQLSGGTTSDKAIVKIKADQIARCPSPLIFKVIDNVVYLVGTQVYKHILNKEFDFTYELKVNPPQNIEISGEPSSYRHTPTEFELEDFMKYAMEYTDENGDSVLVGYKQIKKI